VVCRAVNKQSVWDMQEKATAGFVSHSRTQLGQDYNDIRKCRPPPLSAHMKKARHSLKSTSRHSRITWNYQL